MDDPQPEQLHTVSVDAEDFEQKLHATIAAGERARLIIERDLAAIRCNILKRWTDRMPQLGMKVSIYRALLYLLANSEVSKEKRALVIDHPGTAVEFAALLGLGVTAGKEALRWIASEELIVEGVLKKKIWIYGTAEALVGTREEQGRFNFPAGADAPETPDSAPDPGAYAPGLGAVAPETGAYAPAAAPLPTDPRVGSGGLVGEGGESAQKKSNQPDQQPARAGGAGGAASEPAAWPPTPGSPEPPLPDLDIAGQDALRALTACGVLGRVAHELAALPHVDADRVRATWADVATDDTIRKPVNTLVWRLRQTEAVLAERAEKRQAIVATYQGRVEREHRLRVEAEEAAGRDRVETARRACIATARDDRETYRAAWAALQRRNPAYARQANPDFLRDGAQALALAASIEREICGDPDAEEDLDPDAAEAEAAWAERVAAGRVAEPVLDAEPTAEERKAAEHIRRAELRALAATTRGGER